MPDSPAASSVMRVVAECKSGLSLRLIGAVAHL
jgi:hypothetical protein